VNAIGQIQTHNRAPTGSELLAAVAAWRPDPECLRAGDEYIGLALRCYAGSLSDLQVRRRLEHFAELVAEEPPDIGPRDAAFALAEHCAIVAVAPQLAVQILADLSVAVPGWEPTDPDDIAALVRATYRQIR
jgi:hypothetical protein